MLNTEELVSELGPYAKPCSTDVKDVLHEIKKGNVFVISSGSMLAFNSEHLDSGTAATQTFGIGDPLGFAETLLQQPLTMTFKSIGPVSLLRIKGDLVKQVVNKSGVLAKEIIRYSLARIYDRSRKRPNVLFEDWLLEKYKLQIVRVVFEADETIFSAESTPDAMFFIEEGRVDLLTDNRKILATLQVTDCFGEASLISSRKRSVTAVASRKCVLLRLDGALVEKEIRSEHPLVQLSVIQLLRQVHLMNQMRLVKSSDSIFSN